jgi:hypothetical protein
LGENVVLFVVIIATVVVGQTWLDWRDSQRRAAAPAWAAALALAGVLSITLTVATTTAAALYQEAMDQWQSGSALWSQSVFLISMAGLMAAAVWTKRLRMLLLLAAGLTAGVWVGIALLT